MSTTLDFFALAQIKVPYLVAGCAGGIVVAAFTFLKSEPWRAPLTIMGGGLTGAYLAEQASRVTGWDMLPSAFLLGMVAQPLCQVFLAAAKKYTIPVPGAKNVQDSRSDRE